MLKKLCIISVLPLVCFAWVSQSEEPRNLYPDSSAIRIFADGLKDSKRCRLSILLAAERGADFIVNYNGLSEFVPKVEKALADAQLAEANSRQGWIDWVLRRTDFDNLQAKEYSDRWKVRLGQLGMAFGVAEALIDLENYASTIAFQFDKNLADSAEAREAWEEILDLGSALVDRLDGAQRTLAYAIEKELEDDITLFYRDEANRYYLLFSEIADDVSRLAQEVQNLERRLSGGRTVYWDEYQRKIKRND